MKGKRPFTLSEQQRIIAKLATRRNGVRDQALFVLGCATGFRISELLSITLGGPYGIMINGKLRRYIHVARRNMKRTREGRKVLLNARAKRFLYPLVDALAAQGLTAPEIFIFQSSYQGNRPISIQTAIRIIAEGCQAAGVTEDIGTHSMRKTFAKSYWEYLNSEDFPEHKSQSPLILLQKKLGHKDVSTTAQYLDFDAERAFEQYVAWQDAQELQGTLDV